MLGLILKATLYLPNADMMAPGEEEMMKRTRGGRGSLPDGVALVPRGESLEAVASHALRVRLLAAGDGSEVLHGELAAGQFLTLLSSGGAFECYYLLAGRWRLEAGEEVARLGPGDALSTLALTRPVVLRAITDARFLCLASRPVFHAVSEDLRQLMRLAQEIELKDGYTADHCERIRELSNRTADLLGLPPERRHLLNYAAYLHDVGKVRVPLSILRKPGPLTPAEWDAVKAHPAHGRELLEETFMAEAGVIVEQHHERHDGSGYPLGLSGDAITREAQIIAVVDSYDAMTTARPYRAAVSPLAAQAVLEQQAGRLFHPEVVQAFLRASGR
jgi:HD-GYP domain-containing protein (c-di-GMP phosphodiesterase class II)